MKRALLFGGVPVIAGLALIVMWALADQKASRGNDWTQVIAKIESSTVQPGGVDIAYSYEFGGRQHHNAAGHLTLREGTEANSVKTRYARGRQVLAYVNPAAPSESLLEPVRRPSPVNVLVGVVLLIIGLPLGTFFLREKPSVRTGRKRPVRKPSRPMSRLKPPPPAPRK